MYCLLQLARVRRGRCAPMCSIHYSERQDVQFPPSTDCYIIEAGLRPALYMTPRLQSDGRDNMLMLHQLCTIRIE